MTQRLMSDRYYVEGWAARLVRQDRLPPRYAEVWPEELDELARPHVRAGMRILDVGAGSSPTIPLERRPPGTRYTGLDVSALELAEAPEGSYDETVVADVTAPIQRLKECFDLVVSWQALEHVASLERAFENIRTYLVPGGCMIVLLSGRFSMFSMANRLVPHRAARRLMEVLLRRPPDTVFPAIYDRCWYDAIHETLASWTAVEVRPKHAGAGYVAFSSVLTRAYVLYENRTVSSPNLATHYLVAATR